MTDTRTHLVGGESVAFTAALRAHAYLSRFHPDTAEPATATVHAACGPAGDWAAVIDDGVELAYPGRTAVDAMRLGARARWLAGLPPGQVVLPAAAFRSGDLDVVLTGPPKSGKTSLLLDALLAHGATALAYDALVVDAVAGAGAHVPAIMNVRRDTVTNLPGADRLLADHELDIGGSSAGERYYGPGAFPVPRSFRLGGARRPVLLFLDGFARDGAAGLTALAPDAARTRLGDLVAAWRGYDDIDRAVAALPGDGPPMRLRAVAAVPAVLGRVAAYSLTHHGCPAAALRAVVCRQRWDQLVGM